MITPVPLHRGQTLSSAATTAVLMNSDLLGIPFIASINDSGTLNVMMSCFSFFILVDHFGWIHSVAVMIITK